MASTQETQVQDAAVQIDTSFPGVNVEMKADRSGTVISPVLHNSNITSLNINYGSNSAVNLKPFLSKSHKAIMKDEVQHIFDVRKEEETCLNDVYTELFITEGDIKEVNKEHEIRQIDEALMGKKQQNRPINCNDIFSSLRQRTTSKKVVLTKGIAGIGKTVSVHKFILDWAEEKSNQDIDAMFLLPFRKINLIKDDKFSLHQFLSKFYPDLKDIDITNLCKMCNLAFIFDGLDESRFPLNFGSEMLDDVEEKSSINELITNLVRGDLLPSALVWVTSRPAAANQIPSEFVGLFTEVRGFTDQQKEEYFRKRISDESQASRIISHIKTSRSLYIMCHIPVFCWITAVVLLETLTENKTEEIPTTLTEMYIHFLIIQMTMKNRKHDKDLERNYAKLLDSNKTNILKLAKLAFEQLKKGNTMFYEEELKKCDINVSEDTPESTGMLTEIFKKETGLHEMKVFCFVHLSVQEFLAALHVFMSYLNKNLEELQFFSNHEINYFFKKLFKIVSLHGLLKKAVDKAIESEKGHFDLFLRFLLGISLESNQKLLNGLFNVTVNSTESITKVKEHIKQLQNHNIPAEASVNLYYCLLELKDKSLYEEIQRYRSSVKLSGTELSASMCSVLTYILLMSDEVMDEFGMKMYKTSPANYMRLIPAVRCCRKAKLIACDLTAECCESLSSALSSSCHLIELDLSDNKLIQDSGVNLISDGLKSPNCKLKILRLIGCDLSAECCESLSSALSSNSHLMELNLSYNNLIRDSGVKLISDGLKSLNCKLEILRLEHCDLTAECCESLTSALSSSNSHLKELDLSYNKLHDSGVNLIFDGLQSPNCKLKILRLMDCKISAECCESLSLALQSSNSHLKDLDLSYNNLIRDSGVKLISDVLKSPNCKLEILRLIACNLSAECCESLSSALKSSNSHLRDLNLSYNNLIRDSGVKLISDGLNSPNCKLKRLRLTNCEITSEGCESLASALQSSNSHLVELDLSNNTLIRDSGVKLISDGLKSPNCKLEILRLTGCSFSAEGCKSLSSALQSSNSHLIELILNGNNLQDSGMKLISDGLKSPKCKLLILRMKGCDVTSEGCESLSSALQSSNCHLMELDLIHNELIQDSGVKLISDGLKSPNCKLEILRLSRCNVTEEGYSYLASALRSNPSHLRELDLSYNDPEVSEVKLLSDVLEDPNCRLEKLLLNVD
ncbi:NACHT, LRR and PYD domains-containing protein 3-like [Paramisgurnus dabryanus]|uniref:NACHT, LRR and PYD domains-containing protein 3-like n=1 Tax=Paramisgurnus dabryanus TaxID=90735 RepID=UPI003CCF3C8A